MNDWISLKGNNPPLIDEIIELGEKVDRIANILVNKKLNIDDVVRFSNAHILLRKIENNIIKISAVSVKFEEDVYKGIIRDIEITEKNIEEPQGREEGWIKTEGYRVACQIAFIIDNIFLAIRDTREEFFKNIKIYPSVKKSFYDILSDLNKLCFYNLLFEMKEIDMIKKLFGKLNNMVLDKKGFYNDLLRYSYISSIFSNTKSPNPPASIKSFVPAEKYTYPSEILFMFFNDKINKSLDELTKYTNEEITRSIYGLSEKDIKLYYSILVRKLFERSGWAIRLKEEEIEARKGAETVKIKGPGGKEEIIRMKPP